MHFHSDSVGKYEMINTLRTYIISCISTSGNVNNINSMILCEFYLWLSRFKIMQNITVCISMNRNISSIIWEIYKWSNEVFQFNKLAYFLRNKIRKFCQEFTALLECWYPFGSVADPDNSDADPDPTSEKNRIQILLYVKYCNKKFLFKNAL
jgi:hypothetical protein